MLARREHSQLEMFQKLRLKGFETDDISQMIEKFVDKNLQSDARFAASYIRSRVNKGFGPVKIKYELRERGIEGSLDALSDERPDWVELLAVLNHKKYGASVPEEMKEKAKRMRFFQQKGYTSEMISGLFNNLAKQTSG